MNRKWKRRWVAGVLALVLILGPRCLFGQTPLPTNWWQGMSPEAVWQKAETITSELAFLRGIKGQLKNDPDSGFEHLQRRTADGFVETKIISKNNKTGQQQMVYQNKEGHWLVISAGLMAGFTAKLEFGENADTEKRIAKSIQQPYAYRLMESVLVGTNACIIVSRTMTAPMFDACLEDFNKNLSKEHMLLDGRREKKDAASLLLLEEQIETMLLDDRPPSDNISSEKQCFIRQCDGVVMGCLERNKSGGLTADHLNDVIWVNQTIPEREFIVPKSANNVTAKSIEDFKEAVVNKLQKEITKTKIARERKLSITLALALMGIVGLGSLLWRFRCATAH